MTDRILIFIPAYNCARQLPRVFAKIDGRVQNMVEEVIVIDNCSQDGTIEAATACAKTLGIKTTVMRNQENYSLGGSIKSALLYALRNGYDYAIALHGDDQADIRDLIPYLKAGKHREADLLIGARFHPQSELRNYSQVRIAGNKFLNAVCAVVARRPIYDMVAGLNCFKMDFFRDKFFLKFPDDLTFDAHLLLYALGKKARVEYAAITWREEDQVSNARAVRQALVILRLFLDYVLQGMKIFARDRSGRPEGFSYPAEVVFEKEASRNNEREAGRA